MASGTGVCGTLADSDWRTLPSVSSLRAQRRITAWRGGGPCIQTTANLRPLNVVGPELRPLVLAWPTSMRTWRCARSKLRRSHACGGRLWTGTPSTRTLTRVTLSIGRSTPIGAVFLSMLRAMLRKAQSDIYLDVLRFDECSTTPAADENVCPAPKGARGKMPDNAHQRCLAGSSQSVALPASMLADQNFTLQVPPPKLRNSFTRAARLQRHPWAR